MREIPRSAIGRQLPTQAPLYATPCRECRHLESEHEDDGDCDLCDCEGFAKESTMPVGNMIPKDCRTTDWIHAHHMVDCVAREAPALTPRATQDLWQRFAEKFVATHEQLGCRFCASSPKE